jgi:hypothetical protein
VVLNNAQCAFGSGDSPAQRSRVIRKILGGLVGARSGPRLFPVLLLLHGQLDSLYVFDRVLTGAAA